MSAPASSTTFVGSLRQNWWVWIAAALAALKLSLLRAQPLYAIGDAAHDDALFFRLARQIVEGHWLGPYDQFTLAKGAVYPAFIAGNFYLGLPLRLVEQLLYVGACALAVRALLPVLRTAWTRLAVFLVLLWNPLTFEGQHLTRALRQHLTLPFALIIAASVIALVLRRDRGFRARLTWALLGGITFGLFWNTREEGIWIFGLIGPLGALALWPLVVGPGRARLAALGLVAAAVLVAFLPSRVISTLNERHYGWRGTNESHSREFQAAYGALARVKVGPVYPMIVVSREAREAIYKVSPAFAELQPYLEGDIGRGWADAERFRRDELQISSGWFMWALRDAVAAAGHTRTAADAMSYYARLAAEVNEACDTGRLPAYPRRDGFFPRWQPAYTTAVLQGTPRYLAAMLDFSTFEPNPPFSIGTDDEVRPFRDLTHERISPSLKATHIELPAQRALDAAKLNVLRQTGQTLGAWMRGFLILAHLAALVRLVQVIVTRQGSLLFGLAIGVWLGAAAELALNILAHTTSMPNLYPAAYAPAFPLLLLFALLVTLDVLPAWRPAGERAWRRLGRFLSRHPHTAWSIGVGLVVFGARLREAALYGSEVPFLDQWRVEVQDIIGPWLRGELSPGAFFAPHHEHIPLWTRLLAWLQAAVAGTYDPRWQMFLNAALHACWAGLTAGWLRRHLRDFAALLATVLLLAVATLPHAWENAAWGFQSQFPLALLCLLGFVTLTTTHAPGTRRWWLGQAVGLAGLFTLGSFWCAPLLLGLVNLWTNPRATRAWLAPLGLAALGALLLAYALHTQPSEGALAMRATGLRDFLHVALFSLGWPWAQPGAAALFQLPLILFAFRLRGAGTASAFDRALLVLGLWAAVQAFGLAYARGAAGADFVSRYSDLSAVGVVVNGVILLRLAVASRLWWLVLPVWGAAVGLGLHTINTTAHTAYFHANAAPRAAFRREAVGAYLARHDASALRSTEGRGLIYPDPAAVTRQLDDPRFVALLPARLRGGASPARVTFVIERWAWLIGAGSIMLLLGLRRSSETHSPAPAIGAAPTAWWIGLGTVTGAAVLLWPRPLAWNQLERWDHLFSPATPLSDVGFEFVTATSYPAERLCGAAALSPGELRNHFFGTHIDGPDFVGTVRSQAFKIETPFLVVPVAGYPASGANQLALTVEGAEPSTTTYAGPNPAGIGFWTIDTRAFVGRTARLELHDARIDGEGWIAVAPIHPASKASDGARLASAWAAEQSLGARTALVALCAFSLLAALVSAFTWRRSN